MGGQTGEGDDDPGPSEDYQRLGGTPERIQRHNPTRAPGQNTKSNTTRPTNGREDVQGVPSHPPPSAKARLKERPYRSFGGNCSTRRRTRSFRIVQKYCPREDRRRGSTAGRDPVGAGTGRASKDAPEELPFLKSSLAMEVDIEHPRTIYFVPYTTSSMAPKQCSPSSTHCVHSMTINVF